MMINQDLAFNRVQELYPGVEDFIIHEVFDNLFAWEDAGPWQLLVARVSLCLWKRGYRPTWFKVE